MPAHTVLISLELLERALQHCRPPFERAAGDITEHCGQDDKQPGAVQSMFCNLGGSFGPYFCGAIPTAVYDKAKSDGVVQEKLSRGQF